MAQLVSACYNVNNIRNLEIKCLGYHRTPLQLACGVQHRKVLQCIFVRPWRPSQCKGHMVCKMAGSTFFFCIWFKASICREDWTVPTMLTKVAVNSHTSQTHWDAFLMPAGSGAPCRFICVYAMKEVDSPASSKHTLPVRYLLYLL